MGCTKKMHAFLTAVAVVCLALAFCLANYMDKRIRVPTTFINLDRRADRKTHCEEQLNPVLKHVHRLSAVDGSKIDVTADKRVKLFYDLQENYRWDKSIRMFASRKMTTGEVGCCLSHRNVWERIARNKDKLHLICEDDVVVLPDFHRVMSELVVPADCDIMYLGYIHPGADAIGESVSDNVHRVKFLFGGYGYMLTSKGVSKLLKISPIDRPLDNFLGKLTEDGVMTGYAVVPPIMEQLEYGGVGSDIKHSAHTV